MDFQEYRAACRYRDELRDIRYELAQIGIRIRDMGLHEDWADVQRVNESLGATLRDELRAIEGYEDGVVTENAKQRKAWVAEREAECIRQGVGI